jgi:hypothetical protein
MTMICSALKTLVAVALTVFIGPFAFSQDYAVNVKGDTLKGKLRIFNTGEKKIQVIGADKEKTSIPIFQVKAFRSNNELYHPVKGPAGYSFMKVMKEGYLSLYNFQLPNQTTYDGLLLSKKDGTFLEVPNLTFKKAVKRFLEDCPSTAQKVDAGDFSRNDLPALVDNYNDCIDQKSAQYSQSPKTEQAKPADKPVVAPPAWDTLEQRVTALPEFAGKADALDMIREIKTKLSRGETVPKFMSEGLKSTLAGQDVAPDLDAALQEIK